MRKLDVLIDALFLAFYQILACMVLYFATWMLMKIPNLFTDIGFFATNLIYSIVLGIGLGVLLLVYAYKTTYKAAYFVMSESIVSSVIAILIHLLFTAAFNYTPLLGGMALPLSGVLVFGTVSEIPSDQSMIPGLMPLLIFVISMLIYHAATLFVRKLALNRRLIDRYELTGNI